MRRIARGCHPTSGVRFDLVSAWSGQAGGAVGAGAPWRGELAWGQGGPAGGVGLGGGGAGLPVAVIDGPFVDARLELLAGGSGDLEWGLEGLSGEVGRYGGEGGNGLDPGFAGPNVEEAVGAGLRSASANADGDSEPDMFGGDGFDD